MKIKQIKTNINDKKKRANVSFKLRQFIGLSVLSGLSVGFIAQNLDKFTTDFALGVGVAVVLLVLYFTNKK